MDSEKNFFATIAGRIVVTIISAALIYGLLIFAVRAEHMPLMLIIFATCVYFGWKALNFITPNIFLIMPIGGWLLYFVIKGLISYFIGVVVAPFQIGTIVCRAAAKDE